MWGYFNILPRRAYKWVNAYYFIYNAFWRLTYCQFHKARCYTSQATTPIEHLSECRFLLLITVKVFPHTKQANGFTPVCVRKCLVKWTFWLNVEPQTSHMWAFSPVCVSAWCFKWLRWVKDFPQISQENGLSPVCVRMCWFIVPLWTNCKRGRITVRDRSKFMGYPGWDHRQGGEDIFSKKLGGRRDFSEKKRGWLILRKC